MALSLAIVQKRGRWNVLKRGGELLRESVVETLEPEGQMEIDLPISQEIGFLKLTPGRIKKPS